MELFLQLSNAISKYSDRNAFLFNGVFYTYSDLALTISKIRKAVQDQVSETEKNIGLVALDDIETYAAIVALWFD